MRYSLLLLLSFSTALLQAQVSLTTLGSPYNQNFDTLAATGTSSTVPAGWAFLETGTNANTTYTAGTGSSNAGDTYSFGVAGAGLVSDRAFGGLQSGSLVPTLGGSFTNSTGSTITSLTITYTGEQWRIGTLARVDRLDFQYSLNATALNNGTWVDENSLDFTAPTTTGTVGLLDGNAAANRTSVTFTITGLNIANGATFFLRWNSFDGTGADDGLAIDDFSITPAAGINSTNPSAIGTATSATPGSTTTLSGTITLGTNPASTGLAVVCNLTSVGGSSVFNLPVTGSTFSATYSVPGSVTPAVYSLPCTVTDNQERTGNFNISLTVNGATPNLTINDVSLNEGNSGTTSFTFTVSLNIPAPTGGVTFSVATADNSAVAPGDYTASSLTAQTIPAGSSTYSFSVLVNGDTTVESNETFLVNVSSVSGATVVDGQGQGTIVNDDVAPTTPTPISSIQGSGLASPLALGSTVTAQGVVTALTSNGFFLQTPDGSVDGDPNTSEGIFVFTSSVPTVSVGQIVNSTGTVTEFKPSTDANSRSITEITQASVSMVSSGNPLPAPVTLPALTTTGGIDQYERFEGMRVQVSGSLNVVAPTSGTVAEASATASSNGVFYAVFPGVALPTRESGIEVVDFPVNAATACAAGSGCALPQFDANPERLRIDTDGITGQTAVNVNTGATISNLIGVLHYGFRAYTVLSTAAPTVGGTPITATAASVAPANVVTVAAMNVERLFDTVDDPGGDVVVTTTALNGRLNKMSLAIRNQLRSPDVIALEEVEHITVLTALATKINNDAVAAGDPNPQYQPFLTEGNDIGGIDVAFLVKASTTSVIGGAPVQLGAATTYTSPCTGAQETLNDRPPLRLRVFRNSTSFTIFVNHLRSLISIGSTAACGGTTDGARVRAKRAAQANYLASEIQNELTASPSARIVVVGDFNAFEVNDGYVDVINAIMGTPAAATQVLASTVDPTYPNMTNLLSLLPTAQRYSYVFDGNHQTLDHAILNPGAMTQFVGGGYVRVNADFNEAGFRGNFNTPERYSDHDPVYVRMTTATNVTSQLGVTKTILAYNRGTGLYQSTVTVTNNTANTISGPLQLVVTGVTDKATLTNAASSTPAGGIYNLPNSLAPGQSVSVLLTFSLPASMPVNYTVNAFSDSAPL